MFAHGSGSSRHSPRNKRVAEHLQRAGFGTLLLDLLTADEEQLDLRSRELRFDIGLLGRRLVGAIDWLAARYGGTELPIGLFGASTGAAAALVAAVARADRVAAVVSRDGRPAASPIGGAADACAGPCRRNPAADPRAIRRPDQRVPTNRRAPGASVGYPHRAASAAPFV